jgi:hypothetical protein
MRHSGNASGKATLWRHAQSLPGAQGKGRIACDSSEIKMMHEEINAPVDLPKYWELEAQTVEKG